MSTPKFPPTPTAFSRLFASAFVALLTLSACGGGGGSSGTSTPVATNPTPTPTPDPGPTPDPILADYTSVQNLCAKPRTGVDAEGVPFPDRQGTLQDEMKFLRSWTDKTYLWYNEVPSTVRMADYTNTLDYFAALKTPGKTASGQPKDRFHFTYTTAEWDAISNQSQDTGYGVTWSVNSVTAPRNWRVAIVQPNSPAAAAGLQRGDMLTAVDGIDFVYTTDAAQIDKVNAGLLPANSGENHTLTVKRNGATIDVPMTSAVVSIVPVKNVKVIDTPTGKVGYLSFEDHNAASEQQLIDAFTTLKNQGATDLVLDMRYNGGGLLYIASELAYMVAGPSSDGKTFDRPVYNDKTAPGPAVPFLSTAYGFSAAPNTPLPYLGLNHVTVLTSPDTCSASEAVINGLRGVDVKVDLVGGTTCGKPYGFTPVDNCGTTYFSIQFKGVNAKGYGDYADGFAPTCAASDDMTHALGDPAEGMLAAALSYRANNTCPASTTGFAGSVQMRLAKPAAKKIAIFPKTWAR
jgi:hypothetical protein